MDKTQDESITTGPATDEADDLGHDRPARRRPTLDPAEARERIARGEAIEDVRIVGLVLRGSFERPVVLRNVTLVRPAVEQADFAADVLFEHCILEKPRFGPKATFADLNFRASTLSKPSFRGIKVAGSFRLDTVIVRGQFAMFDCVFGGRARFWNARFGGWVQAERCQFNAEADFRSIHAEEGFVIDGCTFADAALFRGATCVKKWDASGSTFHGLLDLSKSKLHDFVYLETIVQGPGQRFAFHNALAERLLIRTDQLVGRIESEEAGDHTRALEEYGLLKRAFEGLHRYDQEDWAFYRFKVNQRRSQKRSWDRPWTKLSQFADWLLLDLGCGYGTNPLRAVRAALLIMLVFGLVYVAGAEGLYVEKFPFNGRGGMSYFPNRLIVGLLTSVSVFTSGFGSLRDTAQGLMNIPLILESLLGTFLWGLFIVAFSRKVIR